MEARLTTVGPLDIPVAWTQGFSAVQRPCPSLIMSTTSSQASHEAKKQLSEALDQFHLLIKIVACPLLGKLLGRRTAYYLWTRYGAHGGFTPAFFGIRWNDHR